MKAAERRSCLASLGLVDWQPRALTAGEQGAPAADVEFVADEPPADTPQAPQASGPVSATRTGTEQTDLSALDWDALGAWLDTRDHRGARRAVFGTGARDADLLIVGEAPGAREDEQGLPFVGPAGQLLDRMLAAIGRSRKRDVYITNICKFRPPGNRDPHADEIAEDWPVLERQIDLMAPRLLVAVGRVAAQNLLGSTESLGKLRSEVHQYPRRSLPVLVTYHPAYLLRSPDMKARSWADLRRIAGLLGG